MLYMTAKEDKIDTYNPFARITYCQYHIHVKSL